MENFREYLIANFVNISEDNEISWSENSNVIHKLVSTYIKRNKLIGRRSEIEFVLFSEFNIIDREGYLNKYGEDLTKVTKHMFWHLHDKGKFPYGTLDKMLKSDPPRYKSIVFNLLGITEDTKVSKEDMSWVNEVVTETMKFVLLVDHVNKKVIYDLPKSTKLEYEVVLQSPYLLARMGIFKKLTNQV